MADDNLGGGAPGAGQGTGEGKPNIDPTNGAPADKGVAGQAGTGTGEKVYTYKEDRTDWIPRTRLNEESGKRTAIEKERDQARQELEAERRRVQALAGVTPKSPEDQNTEEIQQALLKMFPGLAAIKDLTPEQLQEVFEAAQSGQQASQQHWNRHATQMLTGLEREVSELIGAEKLTPTQVKTLHRTYREEARECWAARERAQKTGEHYDASNDFIARHERGDETLLTDLAKQFLDDWFEPAKRQAITSTVRRQNRPVPRGERTRQTVTKGAPEIDYNNEDAFKKALLAARNEASD